MGLGMDNEGNFPVARPCKCKDYVSQESLFSDPWELQERKGGMYYENEVDKCVSFNIDHCHIYWTISFGGNR